MTWLVALALLAQETERVHVDAATGEITLAGRNSILRRHSDPSDYDIVTDMTVYRGRLFAAACMDFGDGSPFPPSSYSGSTQIMEYLIGGDAWEVEREIASSMILNVRVAGDRLMLPEFSPVHARRICTFDGRSWGELGLLPEGSLHVMDVIRIGDVHYVSGSWRDDGPSGHLGRGRVYRSDDGGKTWSEIYRTREPGRVTDLVEFQGRLWANERGQQLIRYDGKAWQEVPVRFDQTNVDAKLGNTQLTVFAGKIIAAHVSLYYAYNGRAWSSRRPGYIDLWIDGKRLWGLREDGHVFVTEDAVAWTRVTKEGVPAKEFDRQAPKGRPMRRGALALYRDRLFVGTSAEGRIYAAPFEEKGFHVTVPVRFTPGRRLVLSWEAQGPGVRVRYRTAESAEDLSRGAWKESASSPAAIEVPRQHGWAQARVDLAGDGSRTPLLRALTLAGE